MGVLLQIDYSLQDSPKEKCTVYQMSPGKRRMRSINESYEVSELFQGAYPVIPEHQKGRIYPGDRQIKNNDQLTIQVHTLDIRHDGQVISNNIPTLAIWFPAEYERSWMYQQEQGG